MNSILIEKVANGWLVRPFSPCQDWARGEHVQVFVYTKIEDLQAHLPELLVLDNYGKHTHSTT